MRIVEKIRRIVVVSLAIWGAIALAPLGHAADADAARATATFAGGCFWCTQSLFDGVPGVVSTKVGYAGGTTRNPTYDQVSEGTTGHTESVEVVYDPAVIGYEKLLDLFWRNIDPLERDAQFCDRGSQYRTAIFYHDETQHRLAEASKKVLEASKRLPGPIVTDIVPAQEFWPAEEHHQGYHEKNPIRYNLYRTGCGRDRRLQDLWGDEGGKTR